MANVKVYFFSDGKAKTVVHLVSSVQEDLSLCGRDLLGESGRYENCGEGKETTEPVNCEICVMIINGCQKIKVAAKTKESH